MSRNGRNPSPGPLMAAGRKTQMDNMGINGQSFLSGAGVQAALGGLSYTTLGRPVSNGIAPNSPAIPYHASLFGSPKALAGGRINSEPPTPTASQVQSALGRQTPQRGSPAGMIGSPKVGSGYSFTSSTPTRKNSGSGLASTAPPGSLAGISRLVDNTGQARSPGLPGAMALGGGQRGVGGLSATLPATSSRPPSSGQAALATTSRPVSSLTSRAGANVPGFMFSVGSNQSMGSRGYQEDYKAIVDTTSTPGLPAMPNVLLGAAVYDGHGGKQVSHWLASSYCLLNRAMEAVQQLMSSGGSPNDVAGVLDDVFSACGSAAVTGRMSAGSCVAMALMVQGQGIPWLLSANVGDSRTVLVSWDEDGTRPEGTQLSIDHKLGPAKLSEETRRVQAAGGTVIQLFGTWRIDGSLAVARAIGDVDFSRYVSYHPTVSCRQLMRRDRWIIIASDGLWDVMNNEEVALFCKANHQLSATKMSESLVREAVRNRGSGDNTTAIAIRLQYTPPSTSSSGAAPGAQ